MYLLLYMSETFSINQALNLSEIMDFSMPSNSTGGWGAASRALMLSVRTDCRSSFRSKTFKTQIIIITLISDILLRQSKIRQQL